MSSRFNLIALALAFGVAATAVSPVAADTAARQQARQSFAKVFEATFLEDGRDADIRAGGIDNKVLYVKYALVGRPFLYKFNKSKTAEQLEALGFDRVMFLNLRNDQWIYLVRLREFIPPLQ